ncbi:hypothetical protein TRFO_38792 [Tritrichomonas foetus]|uniref:Uncharacterized protein n=1 Tax=Tritrichomonas foetus TaxID=1144522 RepID=A0A1J4J6X0_9EUKA|nr:hypothetical protein TRFO_38792 [Tritrichomonas foetus]|eukprot:OHS94982.1 hypothetical protein TRFO_38792 [Tritrichomonas foetus]
MSEDSQHIDGNAQQDEIHPPENRDSFDRAPRNQSSNIPVQNSMENDDNETHCIDFNREPHRFNFAMSGSRAIQNNSLSIDPNPNIRGSPRVSRRSEPIFDQNQENEEDGNNIQDDLLLNNVSALTNQEEPGEDQENKGDSGNEPNKAESQNESKSENHESENENKKNESENIESENHKSETESNKSESEKNDKENENDNNLINNESESTMKDDEEKKSEIEHQNENNNIEANTYQPKSILFESSSSGYSDELPVDGFTQQYGSQRSSSTRQKRSEEIIISSQDNETIKIDGNSLKDSPRSNYQPQTSPVSRRRQYGLDSLSSFSNADSSALSTDTDDISVSTLNPSDFSENFAPNALNSSEQRYGSKQPQTPTANRNLNSTKNSYNKSNINTPRSARSTRSNRGNNLNNSKASQPQVPILMPPLRVQTKSARKPRYVPPVREEVPEPTQSQLKLMERFMNGESVTDLQPEEYDEIILQLQEARKKRASDHKYKDGQKINNALNLAKNCQLKNQKESRQKEATAEFNEKFEKFKADFQQYDDETVRMKEELKQRLEEQRNNIVESHTFQKKELEEHWTSPTKMRMYNRASNTLAILKKKHKLLLTQARFTEAEEVDQLIKQKIKDEEIIHHEHHQADFDMALSILQAKQKEELNFFDESAQIQIQKLNQNRARLRVGWENQMKRYETRQELLKDSDKLWNAEQFQRRDNANAKMMMRPTQPLGRITAKDIPDQDVPILELPPLNLRENTPKKKKRVKKDDESDI